MKPFALYALLVLAVFVVIVAGHVLALDLAGWIIESGFPSYLLLILSSVAFAGCAAWLVRRRLHRHIGLVLLALALLALLSGHFAAVAFHKMVGVLSGWRYAPAVAVLAAGVAGVYGLRRGLERIRTFTTPRPTQFVLHDRRVRALVLFVSRNDFEIEWVERGAAAQNTDAHPKSEKVADLYQRVKDAPRRHYAALTGDLAKDLAATDRSWNWQQLLRAIEPYLDHKARRNLEAVWLLGSTGGSDKQIDDCKRLLEGYLRDVAVRTGLETAAEPGQPPPINYGPIDFEDFDAIVARLVGKDGILTMLTRTHGVPPREIVIDVTGGQKTASIAAAVVTLNDDYLFQYVQTNHPYKPIIYDARFDMPPEFGG